MSLHALHLANGRTSNTGVFRLMGRLLSGSGVIESAAFTVSAQLTPDMTVKVSGSTASDNLVIITTGGDTYHGWNTANTNVTITSNSSGVTKKDHIVAYVDTALTTTTPDNPAGLVLIAVRGTGTAAPTDSEINTATGSKPWIRLAEVSVANGASSINSGNITNLRVRATVVQPVADSSVTAAKLGSVVTSSSLNISLNDASITATSYALVYGSSTSLSIYEVVGTVDISSLAIPSGSVILQVHCWVNAAGNLAHEAYAPLAVTSVTNTSVAFKGQVAGDGSGSNNFINQTNSKLQLFVRYIA